MIQNPILRGFCPDPSIIRAGDDYYIATSTFEWWPGVKLFHSKNLKDWEQIASPLRRESQLNMLGDPTSGGVWAPCLSYDGTYFYLVFTDVKTKKGRYYNTHNYMIHTTDINGEWSEPVYLNSIGFDPSLFHDTDGKKYLVNMINGFKGVLVQEVEITYGTTEKKPEIRFVGERKKVYSGSGIGYTEGPHIYHIGDWYYLIVAEGGTGYDHCVTMARAKTVWGPFETAPNNPILTSNREDMTALQKCGHADIVETKEGEWYMVHLCSRPLNGQKWCTLGRETAIQKMRFDEEGWMETVYGTRFAQMEVEEPMFSKEASFYEGIVHGGSSHTIGMLPPEYVSPRSSYETFVDLKSRPGYMRLRGQESMNSLHHVSLLALRQKTVKSAAQVTMEFTPDYAEQVAGLTYMYDAMNFYILGKTADDDNNTYLTLIKSDTGIITDEMKLVPIAREAVVKLKCETSEDGTKAIFSYCIGEEENWVQAGDACSTELVTDEHCRGFTGAHFGIYIHDMTGLSYQADFKDFCVTGSEQA